MPGKNYLDSIVNFWRVYSGENDIAVNKCEDFLSKIINVKEFPLTRLSSTTASETAKVLENSYRATNIAFMDEWGNFSEKIGVDMFEILQAIRIRPTHSNIRQPGFGVGGYCLTKDPLFAPLSAKYLFKLDSKFPLSTQALKINREMPLHTFEIIREKFVILEGKKILLAGISYLQNVADTRFSPSEILYKKLISYGAEVICYDPLIRYWEELDVKVIDHLSKCPNVDCIVFTVQHDEFKEINFKDWLDGLKPFVIDTNCCFSKKILGEISALGCENYAIGRG